VLVVSDTFTAAESGGKSDSFDEIVFGVEDLFHKKSDFDEAEFKLFNDCFG
jgi:hypothetical protein